MKIVRKLIYYFKSTMHLGLIYNDHFKDEKKTKTLITSFFLNWLNIKTIVILETLKIESL